MTDTEIVIVSDDTHLSTYTPAAENPVTVYLASLSESSRRVVYGRLRAVTHTFTDAGTRPEDVPWGQMRYQHTQAIRAALAGRYARSTANLHLYALKRVLKEAWRLGQMPAEEYHRAVDLASIRGSGLTQAEHGTHIRGDDYKLLVATCRADKKPQGLRDAALLELYWSTGMRRSEVAAIQIPDVDFKEREIHITGKGNKERLQPFDAVALRAIRAWMDKAGITDGYLFRRMRRGGHVQEEGLSGGGIYYILERRIVEAGLEETFAPHDIRRTFAGNLLGKGVDMSTVQKLMGHSDPGTTAGYDRRGREVKHEAIQKLRPGEES